MSLGDCAIITQKRKQTVMLIPIPSYKLKLYCRLDQQKQVNCIMLKMLCQFPFSFVHNTVAVISQLPKETHGTQRL